MVLLRFEIKIMNDLALNHQDIVVNDDIHLRI